MQVRVRADLPAGQGLDRTSLPRIRLVYDLGCIVAAEKQSVHAHNEIIPTYSKVANIRKRVGIARVMHVNDDIREVRLF